MARLHLDALGVKLTKLTQDQADYLGVPVDGPVQARPLPLLIRASASFIGSGPVEIRDATGADAEAISTLYNALIPTTTVAWTEELETVDERRAWLGRQAAQGHPVLVADDGGEVVGFAAYAGFRDSMKWPGYARHASSTRSTSARTGGERGSVGSLMEELMARARAAGKHVMVGALDGANEASLRFHERLGFVEVARMPEVGPEVRPLARPRPRAAHPRPVTGRAVAERLDAADPLAAFVDRFVVDDPHLCYLDGNSLGPPARSRPGTGCGR